MTWAAPARIDRRTRFELGQIDAVVQQGEGGVQVILSFPGLSGGGRGWSVNIFAVDPGEPPLADQFAAIAAFLEGLEDAGG